MPKINVVETELDGVVIIEPKVFRDERGFFLESWNKKDFEEIGLDIDFVQDNHSRSVKGVLRGLHFQEKYQQGKLVRVVRGRIFDVAVDIRKESPTFSKWVGVYLSDEDMRMFYIPPGFAHGFLVLSDFADVLYKTTEFYYPEYDRGIIWNDKDIGIKWPFYEIGINQPILSKKDSSLPTLREVFS
ncbi:MAG: dTDP-4-dehydrorhamnose 3,5-epimerase [Brevinematia bacterium]